MRRLALALMLIALVLASARAGSSSSGWTVKIEPLATPAAANTGQPQLTVSRRGVLLSWIERAGAQATLKFAERTPAGWTAPRSVASGSDWFVNWADVPSVIRLSDGTLVAHWLQKSGADTYAYDLRMSRFDRRRKDLDAIVSASHGRDQDRTRLRVALRDARHRPRSRVARRPRHDERSRRSTPVATCRSGSAPSIAGGNRSRRPPRSSRLRVLSDGGGCHVRRTDRRVP